MSVRFDLEKRLLDTRPLPPQPVPAWKVGTCRKCRESLKDSREVWFKGVNGRLRLRRECQCGAFVKWVRKCLPKYIPFGKYKCATWIEIAKKDPAYLEWLYWKVDLNELGLRALEKAYLEVHGTAVKPVDGRVGRVKEKKKWEDSEGSVCEVSTVQAPLSKCGRTRPGVDRK